MISGFLVALGGVATSRSGQKNRKKYVLRAVAFVVVCRSRVPDIKVFSLSITDGFFRHLRREVKIFMKNCSYSRLIERSVIMESIPGFYLKTQISVKE